MESPCFDDGTFDKIISELSFADAVAVMVNLLPLLVTLNPSLDFTLYLDKIPFVSVKVIDSPISKV